MRTVSQRSGFTLVELIVALVIGAMIGAAMVQVLVAQNRFVARDAMAREARASVTTGTALIGADLRMVEFNSGTSTGIATTPTPPSDTSLTVRVPITFAIACDASTLVLAPYDSTRLTFAGLGATAFDGYATRTGVSGYTYTSRTGTWVTVPSSSTACASPAPAIVTGGGANGLRLASLVSAMSPAPARGSTVMLYVQMRYRFGNSASFTSPQRRALFVTVGASGTEVELLSPLDTGARFRYFDATSSDTARTSPPSDATTIRGVQFVLPGLSPRIAQGRTTSEAARVATSIFFRNSP